MFTSNQLVSLTFLWISAAADRTNHNNNRNELTLSWCLLNNSQYFVENFILFTFCVLQINDFIYTHQIHTHTNQSERSQCKSSNSKISILFYVNEKREKIDVCSHLKWFLNFEMLLNGFRWLLLMVRFGLDYLFVCPESRCLFLLLLLVHYDNFASKIQIKRMMKTKKNNKNYTHTFTHYNNSNGIL